MDIHQFPRLTDSHAAEPTRRTLLRGLGGGGLAAALLLGSRRGATASGTEDAARMAMGALNQALAIGDDSRLDTDFAPDVVVHPRHRLVTTGEEVSSDLAGMKAALADIRNVVPDLQLIVDALVAEDDTAAGRLTVRGTPVGSAGPVEASALVFMVIGGNRVREIWFYLEPYAAMAMMASVGLASPIPSA